MKIAFYGRGILASDGGDGTGYYRGMLKALARRGADITVYERFADLGAPGAPPERCRSVVYDGTAAAQREAAAKAAAADVVIVANGGTLDESLPTAVFGAARPDALKLWWDVDGTTTTAAATDPSHPLRRRLAEANCVLTRAGGADLIAAYRELGARDCVAVYPAIDPETHHPVAAELRFAAGLGFLGDRRPDCEPSVSSLFLRPAAQLPDFTLLLCGAGWDGQARSSNVTYLGALPAREHNAFHASAKLILTVAHAERQSGVAPSAAVFQAAAAGGCVITQPSRGLEQFLAPGEETVIARDGKDVAEAVRALALPKAREIGRRAAKRMRHDHTYERRAEQVDRLVRTLREGRRAA